MPTPTQCLAVVLVTALSVLSGAAPVTAGGPTHHARPEPVTVTNVPRVIISNTTPIPVVGIVSGGGGAAAPEDGAQFSKQSAGQIVVFAAAELERTGKRFVVDFLTVQAALTPNDCSLVQVRVDDGAVEAARTIMMLQGNASGFWGASQAVKMFVDPGQRILVVPFAPCDATNVLASVVGHYVDR